MNTVFVLMVGRTPDTLTIHSMYTTYDMAKAVAEIEITWPRGWFGNMLVDLGPGWKTAQIQEWQILDAIPEAVD